MQNVRTWIIALIALIVGAGAVYFVMRGEITSLDLERSSLEAQLSEANTARETAQAEISTLNEQVSSLEAQLNEAIEQGTERVADQVARISELEEALQEATEAGVAAQEEISDLVRQIATVDRELGAKAQVVADQVARISELEDALQEATEAGEAVQNDVRDLTRQVSSLEAQLSEANAARETAQAEINDLARQIAAIDNELAAQAQVAADRDARISELEAAEQRDAEQKAQIADSDRRLNLTLAQRIRELSRYRSEFFGKLAQILGSRSDIRVVGDRFVFQSEVLFPTASAAINEAGRAELDKLAEALVELEQEIPEELNWVLRVGGHTDKRPINSAEFRSNWELSAARAISVVRYLIDRGVPTNRLVAAAFGEFQPLDEGESEEALSRNRRIELKLTER